MFYIFQGNLIYRFWLYCHRRPNRWEESFKFCVSYSGSQFASVVLIPVEGWCVQKGSATLVLVNVFTHLNTFLYIYSLSLWPLPAWCIFHFFLVRLLFTVLEIVSVYVRCTVYSVYSVIAVKLVIRRDITDIYVSGEIDYHFKAWRRLQV